MATLRPVVLNELSIYFDGVRWDLFPSVPTTKTHIFYRQDNETYEQFTHRVYALCDAMNESVYFSIERRLTTLEKTLSHVQNTPMG